MNKQSKNKNAAIKRKLGPGDQEYDVVVVRATYRFTEDNWPLFEASHQQPIRWQKASG